MIEVDNDSTAGNAVDDAQLPVNGNLQAWPGVHLMLAENAHRHDTKILDVPLTEGLFWRKSNGALFSNLFAKQGIIQSGKNLFFPNADSHRAVRCVLVIQLMLLRNCFFCRIKDGAVGKLTNVV